VNGLIYLLAVYGATFALVDAKLLQRPRDWLTVRSEFFYQLLSCAFCTGFWVGLAMNCWSFRAMFDDSTFEWVEQSILGAFSGAAFCYVVDTLMKRLESQT
jgi:hypothetical protein